MLIINPGSGPVANATRENAAANMRQFAADCKATFTDLPDDPAYAYKGRFAFTLIRMNSGGQVQTHEIQMPGLPLDQVRYLGPPQNIWDFPRLYVDGSSWVWKYAIHIGQWDDEAAEERDSV